MLTARTRIAAGLLAASLTSVSLGAEGPVPHGIAHLDHVFLIMMENHAYQQIIGNPDAPYLNRLAKRANLATNYYAVAHPSLTNYLEVVGGSNFGVLDDNSPAWHSTTCTTNLASGQPSLESSGTPICPIAGTGMDAPTPALDYSNETNDPTHALDQAVVEVDGTVSFPSQSTVGKTIADQLVANGGTWKSYQEDLPPTGADGVNSADGVFSNLNPPATAGLPNADLVGLYAVKHNPFAYFQSVQEGADSRNSLKNVVGFDGTDGLFSDLRRGTMPNFAFIAPNQCNDQHGRGNAGSACDYDPNDNGTQAGLNPALISAGDAAVARLVGAIESSPVWHEGNNAIVIVWDENDYSVYPTTNRVVLLVDSNEERDHGRTSSAFYTHFSLLKSLEAGFELPCLNHACDAGVNVMSDLFVGEDRR